MSAQNMETTSEVTAVADPGEIGRKDHLWADRLIVNASNIIAWLFIVLMLAIMTQVIIRKLGFNQAWLDDAQWWMYGVAMVMAFGYAIKTDSHVRVDIFHQYFSDRKKARIEIFAIGWLLLPFLIYMADILFHYAVVSWIAKEGSDSPNGLHGVYLLKASLPLLFTMIIIGAFSALVRQQKILGKVTVNNLIVGAFPAIVFIVERTVYYALWWFVRFTQKDLDFRKISREPLLEFNFVAAITIVALVYSVSRFLNRTPSVGDE